MVILTPPDQGSVASFPTEPTFLPEEQLPLPPQLGEEVKVTTSITETQQPTPEEIFKAKNLLEVQLQQEHMNSLALETQKAQLEYDLIQKQTALENNQKLSEQEKQVFQKEINYQTDQIRAKEKEILVQDQKIKQLKMDLQQEKTLNTEKENQIQQLIDQINAQNQITAQLQNQLQVQKSLIEAKNQELITNQQLSAQEKQTLQQEINQLTNDFHQKEQEYQTTIQQQEQEIHQLNQIITEKSEEINRLSEDLEQQMDKWVQQGLHIQSLEKTIKTLENVSNKYLEENAELRREINKLKEQIKEEQEAHEATKVDLKEKEGKLILKGQEFTKIDKMIKEQTTSYSAAIQPLKNCFKEDINRRKEVLKQRLEKATSWFKKWF
ncbi:MAG: hypothetical protein Q8807_02730 ['Waltheria sp.' little leaf phytoplasma]|nr:hypothetical protein ['Waltheria sp.' little leaf phytoplasma]